MRVQTGIPLENWRQVPEAAARAEAQGFDALVSFEIAHDPFIPLGFAATATERIELGTAIAVAFPRSPMIVANLGWDLQTHSGGRFVLGLGTQVKGHNERRFGVPWSAPVPRLREYIESLRAIWTCWQTGEPLDYRGEHYQFTLMTPEFRPEPNDQPMVPVTIAAVGPAMQKLAGRLCDGVRLHGFATRKYLEEVALPEVYEGLRQAGRSRSSFEIWGGGFICTGPDEEAVAREVEGVRYRVAFYGSTRSYHHVFRAHGWEELGMKLHHMSKAGRWKEMAREVPDEVVRTFAAVAPYDQLVDAIDERFGGLVDSITLAFSPRADTETLGEVLSGIRAIPSEFVGFHP